MSHAMSVVWFKYVVSSPHLGLCPGVKDTEGFEPDFWPATAHDDDDHRHICYVVRTVKFHHWAYNSVFHRICVFIFSLLATRYT